MVENCEIFYQWWNFPNGVGAIDWKTQPFNSGCHDRNYKGTESIILLVMIGPECELYVDVGVNGCNSDERVWSKCTLKNILEQSTLNALTPTVLPGRNFFFY